MFFFFFNRKQNKTHGGEGGRVGLGEKAFNGGENNNKKTDRKSVV